MYSKNDYITDYGHFEQWFQDRGYKDVGELESSYPYGSKMRNELNFFRHIRNYMAHNPRADERLIMTDSFKSDFDALTRKLMSELNDVAIPFKDIFKREMSDTISPTIKKMKECVFTHTPIMNGRKVWGVFSENTLFNIAEKNELQNFNGNTRFMDIASYITAYSNSGVYDFISSSLTLDDVKRVFKEATEKGRKLEVLFITTTGRKDGDLKGMITIWDITARE